MESDYPGFLLGRRRGSAKYNGDVHASIQRYTPADNFYDGRPWHGCLVRFRGTIMKNGLELETLPRRTNEPVFREKPYSSNGSGEKQIFSLDSLSLAPLYRADIDF
jgi:hypothetical protein